MWSFLGGDPFIASFTHHKTIVVARGSFAQQHGRLTFTLGQPVAFELFCRHASAHAVRARLVPRGCVSREEEVAIAAAIEVAYDLGVFSGVYTCSATF